MAEDDRAKTRCYAEHFLYEPKQLRCFSYGWNKREGRYNLLLPLKNRSRFRRSREDQMILSETSWSRSRSLLQPL